MAPATSQNVLASQAASLLSELAPETALRHDPFREALHRFFKRGGQNFRGEVSNWLNLEDRPTKKQKRTGQSGQDPKALAFFLQQRRRGEPLASDKISDMLDALGTLKSEASLLSKDAFQLAHASSKQSRGEDNRQRYVVQQYYQAESKTRDAEISRRLWLLSVEYEVRRLQPDAFCGTTPEGVSERGVPDAEKQFATLSGYSKKDVHDMRTRVRPCVHVSTYKNGLGLIYLLGPQTRRMWDRLSNMDISCVLDYSLQNVEEVWKRAEELQLVACEAVVCGFRDRTVDPAELQEHGHVFSKHFMQPFVCPAQDGGTTALNALAAAAERAQSNPQSATLLERRRDSMVMPDLQFPDPCSHASLAVQGHAQAAPLVENGSYPPTDDLRMDMRPYDWHHDDSMGANSWEEWMHALDTSLDFELPPQAGF